MLQNVHPFRGAQTLQATNGDLDFFEELPMTALLYRGHAYAAAASAPKACIELTYRREHYNTCREEVARDVHPTLTYRGVSYNK